MSIEAGTVISHYRVESKLGAGGMGEVYLARDTQLDRAVALKILLPGEAASPDRMRRFSQEARAASALSHPNVAHIYEVGDVDGVPFIAMEYVEGQTLAGKIAGRRPLPLREILEIGAQTADALDEAHSKKIVHRDIKAGNIMITPRGQVKVLDFGLAKVTRSGALSEDSETRTEVVTRQGVVMGTLPYMSPEQVTGQELDARSDIFSLGVVLYEMATGRMPFAGTTGAETIRRIMQEQPDAVARFNYDAPAELERIIRKCLEKEPGRRYQSARELVVDLRSLERPTAEVAQPAAARRSYGKLAGAAVLVIALAAAGVYLLRGRGGRIDSIAVLPFVNAANDPNLEYLSDGLTEELINGLTQVPGLKVMARATVFSYKGRQAEPLKVGRELHVLAVLLGRVTQRGDDVTVQAELVNATDGSQLWGQQYYRKAAEFQNLQQEIARQIADKLRLKLSNEEEKRQAKQQPVDPQAYELYLRGRHALSDVTPEEVRKSPVYFEQAIARDPKYAPAYAGLADSYSYLGIMEIAEDTMPKAKEAALKALELDSTLAEAHTSLGIVKALHDWDWSGAGREFEQSMELNAGSAYVRHWHAHYQEFMGRWADALVEMRKALELDPLNPMIGGDLGNDLYYNRQYDEAIRHTQAALQLSGGDPVSRISLSLAYEGKGMRAEAMAEVDKALEIAPTASFIAGSAAGLYCRAGQPEKARKLLVRLSEAARKQHASPLGPALVHIALGEKDEGFRFLEQVREERSVDLVFMAADPVLDSVRSDPRFVSLMKTVGLPEALWAVRFYPK